MPAVAIAVASAICDDVCVCEDAALPARSATRPVMSDSAWVWDVGALPARAVTRPVTSDCAWVCESGALPARSVVRLVTSASAWRARDGRERDGDVHTVAGGHVQERQADVRALDQVQRAAGADRRAVVLDGERERAGDDIGGHVRVRGQVAGRERRASRGATPCVHRELRVGARRDAGGGERDNAAATAMPPTGSICTTPLASVVASGTVLAPNVWPAAKSMTASIARWLLAFNAMPRSPELSCFLHLTAPALGRRTRPVLDFVPAPNSAPSWNVLRPVTVTAPSFRM